MGIDIMIIIAVVVIVYGWLAWEAYTAPVKPDDYDLTDEERILYKEYTDEIDKGM